jgi:hypothetical protein
LYGPLADSVRYVGAVSRPGTRDVTADWIERNLPEGSRILTTLTADLGLDPSRFEVLRVARLDEGNQRLALEVDAVVAGPGDEHAVLRSLPKLFIATPDTKWSGPRLRVLAPPPGLRTRYRPLDLEEARWTASGGAGGRIGLRGVHQPAAFGTAPGTAEEPWVQVDLDHPAVVGRVELLFPLLPKPPGVHHHVFVAEPGGPWHRVTVVPGRPPLPRQRPPRSEVLLLPPARIASVRIVQTELAPEPWMISELRLWEVVEP